MFSRCEFCSTYPRLLDWQRNFGPRKRIRKQNTINSCSVFHLGRNFVKVELWRPEVSCELPSLPHPRFQHSAAWVSISMSLSLSVGVGISLSMSISMTLNHYKCHDLLTSIRTFPTLEYWHHDIKVGGKVVVCGGQALGSRLSCEYLDIDLPGG